MPAPADTLRAQQFALAAHIRDPARNPPPPGIEDRRLRIYRELFYSNIESLLAGNFPVIRRILADAEWHALARDFYREHRCETPLFPEIAREFIRYLELRQNRGGDDPPWLLELAHYEWVELALEIAEDDADAQPAVDSDADLLANKPVLSALAWPLAYRWPVHRLSPDFLPSQPPEQPTFLLVSRDAQQTVRFREISGPTFRLLQRIGEHPADNGHAHLLALAAEAAADNKAVFVEQGGAMLDALRADGILIGSMLPA